MYRTKIKELKKWKLSKKRKPLIFLGARQVGKTWLIQEFGKTEYKQMAYIKQEEWLINLPLYAINSITDIG
jgi:predicted AAA+ superfamily ATPase